MNDAEREQNLEKYELKPEEIESVCGGRGGSPTILPPKPGLEVYQIKSHDTLSKIARAYDTTAAYLMSINPSITNEHDITAGFYIYVPA